MSIVRNIALRYLRAKRKETFISLIAVIAICGVGLGVTSLIVVLAVMSGFETNLKTKLLGITPHITVMKYGGQDIEDWPQVMASVEGVKGVKSVEPFVDGQVLASAHGRASGMVIKGIDAQMAEKSGHFSQMTLSPGALEFFKNPDDLEAPPIILGFNLAMILGANQYDQVKLISPFGRITPMGSRAPINRYYQVVGTVRSGFADYDANVAYMSLDDAQELMGLTDGAVSNLEVRLDDVYQAETVKADIIEVLGPESDFWARDWIQANLSLFSALKLEQAAMFVVLTLTILVAAFNIVATLIMMVMEKTRDIAILKSMGATRRQIRMIFTLQGLMVGLVGAVSGLLFGVGLCFVLQKYEFISLPEEVYAMSTLPVEMRPMHLILTFGVTVLISFLATIYPAAQAAKLDPVEALRYE